MNTSFQSVPVSTVNAEPPRLIDRIVLAGFMGAGKSTVGRLLASELGWQFTDTDAEIERRCGRSIAEMFRHEGEAVFRRRESLAMARALGQHHAVIALGGGAPEFLTNRLLLEQTPRTAVIFLDAPFDVLFDRCVMQEGTAVRPVFMDAQSAAERYALRAPYYRRCAQFQVRTQHQTPTATVTAILALLESNAKMIP